MKQRFATPIAFSRCLSVAEGGEKATGEEDEGSLREFHAKTGKR